MSIEAEIKMLIDEGRLVYLQPKLSGAVFTRAMLMSPEVANLALTTTLDKDRANRCGMLRGDLEMFAEGGLISVSMTPFKAGAAYMGCLHPIEEGIFDIRSRDPSPAIRVLGGFVLQDVFVALTWAPRSRQFRWSNKRPLDGRDSSEWRAIIKETKKSWKDLFGQHPPLPGGQIHDILSNDAFIN